MIALDAMLSKMLNLGLNPLFMNYSINSLKFPMTVLSFVFGIGFERIAFELKSYITNIVTILSSDFTRNLPVHSISPYQGPLFTSPAKGGSTVIVLQNN